MRREIQADCGFDFISSDNFELRFSVFELYTVDDFRQLVLTLQSPPGLGRGPPHQFEHHEGRQGVPADSPSPSCGRCDASLSRTRSPSIGFEVRKWIPMIEPGKVEERQQRLTILDQGIRDGPSVRLRGRVFSQAQGPCQRRFRRAPVRRQPSDLAQIPCAIFVGLSIALRELGAHVQCLVQPASLIDASSGTPRRGPSRNPSAPSPMAACGATTKPRAFKSTSSSLPALPAFRCRSESRSAPFLPSGVAPISTSMHSAWPGSQLSRACRIDAVRPDVDVMARRQIALLPSSIFVPPHSLLKARDHSRGKVGRVPLTEQGPRGPPGNWRRMRPARSRARTI